MNSDDGEDDITSRPLKFTIIGDCACGKTSLVNYFVHETIVKEYNQTLGVEFYRKTVCLPEDCNVSVQIWDVGGQGLGGEMLDKYLYGSDGILMMYDITNETSFVNLEDWLSVVRSTQSLNRLSESEVVDLRENLRPYIALIGNKCDSEHLRLVKKDNHDRFVVENALASYTLSARTGEGVNFCFRDMVAKIVGVNLTSGDEVAPSYPQPVLVAEIVREIPERPPTPTPNTTSSLFHINHPIAASAYRSPICTLQ